MDKEILDMFKAQLLEIRIFMDSSIDELDNDGIDSPSTGKVIVPDFDDTDLTNIQMSIDAAVDRLQDLSDTIGTYL